MITETRTMRATVPVEHAERIGRVMALIYQATGQMPTLVAERRWTTVLISADASVRVWIDPTECNQVTVNNRTSLATDERSLIDALADIK